LLTQLVHGVAQTFTVTNKRERRRLERKRSANSPACSCVSITLVLGVQNTALGYFAGFSVTGTNNTAVGGNALFNSTGNGNTALGAFSGGGITTANNVICIGGAGANLDNSCFIANIYSNAQPIVGMDPDSVTITSNGRLGRGNVSSRRYKHDILPMDNASEALYALKPVSFRYNKEYDATQTLAFGLIAEEVAEVIPDLVGRNPEGQPESVRYEQINAMLLNEFLKEHRKNEEQEAMIARQQKQIDALTAGLQKVSAQLAAASPSRGGLEASTPALHVANNN
jgi:Chaperone of endosialidase